MADNEHPFTCLSCTIAFTSANEQREHYRSDHHRYNMKRRVAGLPPVSADSFNQKVLERRAETAIMSSPKGTTCEVCNKTYSSENAYRSHINSKKHKDAELKAASKPAQPEVPVEESTPSAEILTQPAATEATPNGTTENDDEVMQSIDEKIAAARSRLSINDCLFCSTSSSSLEDNLTHMASSHSFFIPDADYLVNLTGLITYLDEKVAVGNVCLFCNGKGRDFRTLDAVRKHMVDKSHCKLAYDTEADRLELSDYYDFTSSYASVPRRPRIKTIKPADPDWEDVEDDNESGSEVDEVVVEEGPPDSEEDSDLGEELQYGDTEYTLVLPSGARIGHRSLRKYYSQRFSSLTSKQQEDPNSGAALVRRLLKDKNSALVPRKGGFGAYGTGTDVIKARNRGEAREAGRHVREFRDQKRREDFKTRVGFNHNHQKHYRDPLLQ